MLQKKLAEDATLKGLARMFLENIILESLKTFLLSMCKEISWKATLFDVDGVPLPEEVIIESI